jgi:hypothetical protein
MLTPAIRERKFFDAVAANGRRPFAIPVAVFYPPPAFLISFIPTEYL